MTKIKEQTQMWSLLAQAADEIKAAESSDASATAQVIILAMLVIKSIYDWFKDAREHKWQVEKEEREKEERNKIHQETSRKIAENTAVNLEALKEANRINQKLVMLGEWRNLKFDQLLDKALEKVITDEYGQNEAGTPWPPEKDEGGAQGR